MLDLSRNAYIFAQTLDNSGQSEYWIVGEKGQRYDKMEMLDGRSRFVRMKIDAMSASTRRIPLDTFELEGRANLSGDCLITVRPVTLDFNGRVSPVQMLFNIYGDSRMHATTALRVIPEIMGRELSQAALVEIERLHRMLTWPRLFLFFYLIVAWTSNKK